MSTTDAPNVVQLADARWERKVDEFQRLLQNDPPLPNTVDAWCYDMGLNAQGGGYIEADGTMGIVGNIQVTAIVEKECYHLGLLRITYEQWQEFKEVGDGIFDDILADMTKPE